MYGGFNGRMDGRIDISKKERLFESKGEFGCYRKFSKVGDLDLIYRMG